MDVPHGREVIIPADKAARSKDLWRAISQKCIFKMPNIPPPARGPLGHVGDSLLQERLVFLEQRCKQLEDENTTLRESLRSALAQGDRLDTILSAIQSMPAPQVVHVNGHGSAPAAPREEIADGTAPQFIPSEIAPKDAETRIDTKRETGDSSNVNVAAERLRKMRQGRSDG